MMIHKLFDSFTNPIKYGDNFTKPGKDIEHHVVTHYRRDAHLGVQKHDYRD